MDASIEDFTDINLDVSAYL